MLNLPKSTFKKFKTSLYKCSVCKKANNATGRGTFVFNFLILYDSNMYYSNAKFFLEPHGNEELYPNSDGLTHQCSWFVSYSFNR